MSDKMNFEKTEKAESKVTSGSNAFVSNEEMKDFSKIIGQSQGNLDCSAKYLPDMNAFIVKCVAPLDEAPIKPTKPEPIKPQPVKPEGSPLKTPEQYSDQNSEQNANTGKVPRDGGLKDGNEGTVSSRNQISGHLALQESTLVRPFGPQ